MNILVCGGAGFIGSHLIDSLMTAGHNVVCADNLCLGSKKLVEHHFENNAFKFYEIDIHDNEQLERVFAGYSFDRVYHLAANSDIQKGGTDPTIDIRDTLNTTLSLLQTMYRHDIKELLFSSTSAIYGDKRGLLAEEDGGLSPISYYGGAKLASEAMISAFAAMNDMRVNIVRFPNVVGPRLTHGALYDFVRKLRNNPSELEILGDGSQEKPYVYVTDLIDAMLFLPFGTGVGIFNVGVTTATTARRIADIVCEEMGLFDVTYRFTGGNVGWKGDVAKFQYDLSKIHGMGWTAKLTSDEAVRMSAKAVLNDVEFR